MSIHINVIIIIIPFLSLIFPFIHCLPNYTIETFPDSLIKPDLCNLNAPGLACDPDQLLRRFNQTLSGAEYLSHYLQQIRYATKCPCLKDDNLYGHCSTINPRGYTISIAVMRSIEMINDDMMNTVSRNRTVQVFAEMLRRRQHRGQCADDALIVAITDWKIVYTSVDEVIGRALTTSAITEVNREAESLFTSANYLYGLTFMVNRYGQILQYSERKSLSMIWSLIMNTWLHIFLTSIILITSGILVILLIIRFCCNKKQTYTVGRQIIS
ncbi:hypothetical protein LOAG_15463 [Loa loa]|uniref:TPM domain-containing protein n=1 Tax=Loa loa TaxID=7209 RepID=A0A1S0TFM3_LOALO|nr:hypothetical protein LOAG_15463 [Loa loa]EFO13067.2 hypothetical protein LOAG_15463 [Loa loa]